MSDTNLESRARHLLSLAKTIRQYEEALCQANGEHFNLFEILHVGHYEVRTHSPMLAELLNPKGSHGQGAVFLKHFLDAVKIQDFEADSARVATEVFIGDLGRIDIEIADRNNRRVVIENKIYAALQDKQLERYQRRFPQAHLLYLTLNCDDPPDGLKKIVQSISYRSDILRWLESCRKEVATAPCVREAITQYIHLIQRLTQQNTSARMNQEIIKAVTHDSSSYLAYASLRNANGEIRRTLVAKVNAQLDAIGREFGLVPRGRFAVKGERYEGYFFTTPALEAQNLMFGFECQGLDYRDFCFGFSYIDVTLGSALKDEIAKHFPIAFGVFASSKQWPACPPWNQHRNWDDETMAAIVSDEFSNELKALIGKLAEVGADVIKASAAVVK